MSDRIARDAPGAARPLVSVALRANTATPRALSATVDGASRRRYFLSEPVRARLSGQAPF